MKSKKVWIAAGVLVVCLVLSALGYNSLINAVGYLSAGFLFGMQK